MKSTPKVNTVNPVFADKRKCIWGAGGIFRAMRCVDHPGRNSPNASIRVRFGWIISIWIGLIASRWRSAVASLIWQYAGDGAIRPNQKDENNIQVIQMQANTPASPLQSSCLPTAWPHPRTSGLVR